MTEWASSTWLQTKQPDITLSAQMSRVWRNASNCLGASRNTYSLKTETVGDSVFISVLRSADISADRDLFLLLHTRGIIHYAEWWDGNYSKLSFDRRDFPSGILQAILFDAEMNPLSERLVFCLNDDQAKAEFKTDRQNYEKRQPVYADVTVTGPDGLPRER
ncbi:MAG: hypothetical protein MZV63_67230 [Marinilabiliales bacterium]|nr:hypothetical protein [Marinilabiliales bacterium]